MIRSLLRGMFLITVLILWSSVAAAAQEIPPPEQFFGFQPGADGKLAHWNKIVEYFHLLDERSDRLTVQEIGKTTLGNPFLLATFSSPENLENLDRYREISKQLADPRGLSEEEISRLIKDGKYVSVQTYSMHATEVGGTQGTPSLAYELVTGDDPTLRMILDNTIFLMIPCFNPDGEIMVTEWYNKYKDTDYNNTKLPYLYHYYVGHDNNRDSYQLTQNESRLFARVVYRNWGPQSYVDHHHMGSFGARFYIPPYLDPIHPNVDPLIWREHQLYGAHMAVALEDAGKSGFETGVPYTGWWQASFHMSTNYHNITGMLTESASADWADPVYVLPDQLRGTRGRPEYKPQMSMPRLWPGGWWHLKDIVEQQKIATKAVLELGARYRETMLRNTVLKAQGNVRRGLTEPPYAYIIPADQHDFPTAVKLVRTFQMNGVEVQVLNEAYRSGTKVFAPGSFVFSLAQPMRAFIKSFLEQVNYPDNVWTRSHSDQSPIRPYDLAGYSVSEQMGVDAVPITDPLRNVDMSVLRGPAEVPAGTVSGSGGAYLLTHASNESFRAVNRLLDKGYEVDWLKKGIDTGGGFYPPGTMLVSGGEKLGADVRSIASELGLDFSAAPPLAGETVYRLRPVRIGIYKRYAGGNMDAGWTDWLLKDFEFHAKNLLNKDMKSANLEKEFDVIIIPSDGAELIIDGLTDEDIPPEYRGGIGSDGVENIKRFVQRGGTLITLNGSWEFAQKTFDLPLANTLDGVSTKDFYCPGSTLKISIDTDDPLGYGMPHDAFAMFRRSPSLQVTGRTLQDRVSVPVRYHEENILQSGWLIGEDYLSEKPAVLEFQIDKGMVAVLAFPVQHRAQTHGTFKLLFNAIYYGPADEISLQ